MKRDSGFFQLWDSGVGAWLKRYDRIFALSIFWKKFEGPFFLKRWVKTL
jgi:hypothetical protein